ncbi:MAG: hypothetical protein KDA79_23145 [Planctomycetaceae bacterium]|nr:hypothetical protein [Planctomycetaceae bacterium]
MPQRRSTSDRNAATLLALGFLLFCGVGLLALVALVMPQALGLVLVGGGFVLVCGFHYLVWGWWLSSTAPPPEEEIPRTAPPADLLD